MDAFFLYLAIFLPFGLGILLLFLPERTGEGAVRALGVLGFAVPLAVALFLALRFGSAPVEDGYRFLTAIDTGLSSLGIELRLGLNGISLPLFLLAGIVGFAAGLHALQSNAPRLRLYIALLLVMQAGLMGTFSSVDIFFFYFFHEFALVPTFVMIGIWGGFGRRSAAIEMTIYLTLGALLSLLGLLLLYVQSGAESFSLPALRDALAAQPLGETVASNAFALLLFGFGILVSLFPFHSWAPRGYAAAPTATAMLHAGVLKKFGLYGLIQIAYPLLPEGAGNWQGLLVWLALGNVVLLGFVTMAQRDLKQMIGYSSVMHMGYAFLGLLAFSTVGVGGAVLLLFGHGLSVALLFMLSTAVYHRTQTYDMQEMGGLIGKAPILAAFFAAATFASVGLPGFANFWGEFTIFISLWETYAWALIPAALGIIISAIYGLRAFSRIFMAEPSDALKEHWEENQVQDLQVRERVPACILLAGLLVVGFFPAVVTGPLDADLPGLQPVAAEASETILPHDATESSRLAATAPAAQEGSAVR